MKSSKSFKSALNYLRELLHAMVGVPDYGRYLAHFSAAHPGETPMNYETFYKQAQADRYSGRRPRCC